MIKGYIQRANELVEEARKSKAGRPDDNYKDNKIIISPEDFNALLGAGGLIKNLNSESGNSFINEVIYEEHIFIHTSCEPYIPRIEPSLRF